MLSKGDGEDIRRLISWGFHDKLARRFLILRGLYKGGQLSSAHWNDDRKVQYTGESIDGGGIEP